MIPISYRACVHLCSRALHVRLMSLPLALLSVVILTLQLSAPPLLFANETDDQQPPSQQQSASESTQVGMNNWADNTPIHIEENAQKTSHLLNIPEWTPGYLLRSMNIPAPFFDPHIAELLAYESKTALAAIGASALAVAARPVMRHLGMLATGYDHNLFNPSLSGIFWNLLSARVLIQIISAESIEQAALQSTILSLITPGLHVSHHLYDKPVWLSSLPARTNWPFLLNEVKQLSASMDSTPHPISFEDNSLNSLFNLFLRGSTTDKGLEPVIDMQIISRDDSGSFSHQSFSHQSYSNNSYLNNSYLNNSYSNKSSATSDLRSTLSEGNKSWLRIHQLCEQTGVGYIRLFPLSERGEHRLYLQTWRHHTNHLQPGKIKLVARAPIVDKAQVDEGPVSWWSTSIGHTEHPARQSLNPLSFNIINKLEPFILSSAQEEEEGITSQPYVAQQTPNPFIIKHEQAIHHDRYGVVYSSEPGMVFIDWNDLPDNSLLPRLTLLTNDKASSVSLAQLDAIDHVRTPRLHPSTRLFLRIAHDIAWFAIAHIVDRYTSAAGDGIYQHLSGKKRRVNFDMKQNIYHSA